jgi:hypothetical protein
MTAKELVVLEQVAFDLRQGKLFYDDNQEGIGDYFFDRYSPETPFLAAARTGLFRPTILLT